MPSDNNQEMFPIVDEQGNITGAATRGECHSGSKLLHPVVHLHVFNAQGDIYLQNWASQTSPPSFSPVMFLNPAVKKSLFLSTKPFMRKKSIPATNWTVDDFGRSKK